MAKVLWIIALTKVLSEIAGTRIFVVKITVKSIVLKLWLTAHERIKKLETKSFPSPFSMPTQQCYDNTIGCDSRFRSNITFADGNPPSSWVNNTPFRHQVDSQECLQPPDPASHHIAARNEISSQLVWSTSESLATVSVIVAIRVAIAVQPNLANGPHIARSHTL